MSAESANSRFAPSSKYHQQAPPPNHHHVSGGDGRGGYQSFTDIGDPEHNPHLFIHVASGQRISKPWQHYISDLDDFFERCYYYFIKSGFWCIVAEHLLALLETFLLVFFTFFFLHNVDYEVLFRHKVPTNATYPNTKDDKAAPLKITISDCLIPMSEVSLHGFEIILLVFAGLFILLQSYNAIFAAIDNYAIRAFFTDVLLIHNPSMYTWQEVQTRLIRNQNQCLIREGHLDELIIHNRLLRRTNYTIALINKGMLPIYYRVPFVGETIFLTKGLEFNLNLLLFRGRFSLFEKNWKLRDEVKSSTERLEAARRFKHHCMWLCLVNCAMIPVNLFYQLIYFVYQNVQAVKLNPSFASARTWSRYGRWFCRHFNELEHELDQRLNRAHRPATRYMNMFTSPLMAVLARFYTVVAGSLLSILILLTVYDEDVISVEHVLTLMTMLVVSIGVARSFMPDLEPNRWSFAELDAAVIQHIHYRPHGHPAHTYQARDAMSSIFVYRITTIFESLLCPLVTPFFIYKLASRSLDIVDFFRVYTLELADIGDVCSFSQFNFQQNGHRIFSEPLTSPKKGGPDGGAGVSASSLGQKAEVLPDDRQTTRNGKLELSLIHFKLMNPSWQPADNGQAQFIDRFTRQSRDDPTMPVLPLLGHIGPLSEAANSHSTVDFRSTGEMLFDQPPPSQSAMAMMARSSQHPMQSSSMQDSLNRSITNAASARGEDFGFGQKRLRLLHKRYNAMFSEQEERDTEMALSSLYFHERVSDSVTQDDGQQQSQLHQEAPGATVSFSLPNTDTTAQVSHRRARNAESIPLLHASAQDPPAQ